MRASMRLWMSLVAIAMGSSLANAAPSLRVKAQTRIDAHVTRSHGDLLLQGQVKDDLASPIATTNITISLKSADGSATHLPQGDHAPTSCASRSLESDGTTLRSTTDEAGRFCVRITLPPSKLTATITAAGTDYLTDSTVTIPADLTRQAVVLGFDPEPRIVSLDAPPADLDSVATFEEDDASNFAPRLPLVLETELGQLVAQQTTDSRGRARFHLDATKLGPAGRGELVLRYLGSATNAESVHRAPIERDARVLLAPKDLVRGGVPEDGVPIVIVASAKSGPVASGSVEAKVGDVVVGAAAVGPSGEADLVVTFGTPRDKEVSLRVRYVPDAPWLKPGDDLQINLPIDAPNPLRQVPLIVIGGALAAWLIAGRLAQRRAQQTRPSAPARSVPAGIAGISIIGPPRSRRGPLVGRVVDAHDGMPVVRARVAIEETRIQDRHVVASVFTDDEGRFRLDAQTSAAMHLVCEGPLHAQIQQHMPQAAEIEVALVLRKRRVLDRLVRWARASGPPFDVKPEATPGQVRRAADRDRPDVEKWAEAVERAAYDEGAVDARVEAEIDDLHPDTRNPRAR